MKINNIDEIRAFIFLYQEKSYTKAAAKLKISKAALSNKISNLEENIKSIFNDKLRTAEAELDLSKHRLELLNPRSVLKKGYSVVRQTGGAVVKNSKSLNVGQNIELIFYQGSAKAEVKEILK
jgi:exodeoxyribonuclease VII large subunit